MVTQYVIDGLITGALYVILAIGFLLVFRRTRTFHIAMAVVYIVAATLFLELVTRFHLPVLLSGAISVSVATALGYLSKRWAYRPLAKVIPSRVNTIMIGFIAILTFVLDVAMLIYGNESRTFNPDILPQGNGIITNVQSFIIVGAVIAIVSLLIVVLTEPIKSIAFLLSGMFIGITACLSIVDVGMNANVQMTVILNAIVVMCIGSEFGILGCVLGGLAIGVLQSLTVYILSPFWHNAIAYIAVILFLLRHGNISNLHSSKQNNGC